MLTLQRASAGSGKTYTLTKKYIRLLISIPEGNDNEGNRRLRSNVELADSVQHILAVTFTNKATNEMKERILSKLNDLAYPSDRSNPLKTDYMKDFTEEFKVSPGEISAVCREAMKQILFYYSDFNISTIDSFFQTILRTFAYESDLPDSYQLIIESNDVSKIAAKELVDDYSSGKLPREEREWLSDEIRSKIQGGDNAWTLFQRKEGGKRTNLFTQLCEMANALEKEEFKTIKESVESYFERGGDLREAYKQISAKIDGKFIELYAKLRDAAQNFKSAYLNLLADPEFLSQAKKLLKTEIAPEWSKIVFDGKNTSSRIEKILSKDADPTGKFEWDKKGVRKGEKVFASTLAKLRGYASEVEREVADMLAAYDEWKEYYTSTPVAVWNLIRPGLSRMALMINLRGRISQFLADNDAMQLADTNTILRRIINDDDVPFIYERTGSRINHFLIDEFQDTSLLQWKNFKPLLEESQGKGNENLIIGDAKQSIYRFRNAEPKLITEIVPATFPREQIDLRGFSEEENANWRSLSNVVKFNNYVFHHISRMLDDHDSSILNSLKFENSENVPELSSITGLYKNTIQLPKSKGEGYVEVDYIAEDAEASDSPEDEEEKTKISMPILKRVGELVASLLKRGYRQRDIAILVDKKKAGENIISYLMDYSRSHKDEIPHLQFVSEDSLRLGRSEAVLTIIECFKTIQSGIEGDFEAKNGKKENNGKVEEKGIRKGRINWVDIAHKFRNYSLQHPDLKLHGRLNSFLKQEYADERLEEMMDGMQAVTLPSLMEMIVENFVPADLRAEEAPFIAALGDAILDYCDAYPTDIASMLRWWERTGKNITISSPEGTEAINVMTIHKSKGLEFNCVICPDINLDFKIRKEWTWMSVPQDLEYSDLIPENMPIYVTPTKIDEVTYLPYLLKFSEMQHLHKIDQINKGYVALTRAVGELYILLDAGKEGEKKRKSPLTSPYLFGDCLKEILDNRIISEVELPPECEESKDAESLEVNENGNAQKFSYGRKIEDVKAYLEQKEKKKDVEDYEDSLKIESEVRDIEDYYVNSDLEILKYHQEGYQPHLDPADEDRMDPRSEGTMLHEVLEHVIVEEDLPRALEYMHSRGKMTRADIMRFQPELQKSLESVRSRGWYGGENKVFTEHPVVHSQPQLKRPDRIMITPEGVGIVLDYKFGTSENRSEHIRQVREYMTLLRLTGICCRVEGYLWYLRDESENPGGRIEPVEFPKE